MTHIDKRVGLFCLRLGDLGRFCLWLVLVAYGNLAWSFLLMLWLTFGWSLLLAIENRFGIFSGCPLSGNWVVSFCLQFPHRR